MSEVTQTQFTTSQSLPSAVSWEHIALVSKIVQLTMNGLALQRSYRGFCNFSLNVSDNEVLSACYPCGTASTFWTFHRRKDCNLRW
jgi:hypothetical protein